ncbi:MAG TPA: hypothetical protein VIJ68_00775 [Candidatus Saccharimonadales bacterium]
MTEGNIFDTKIQDLIEQLGLDEIEDALRQEEPEDIASPPEGTELEMVWTGNKPKLCLDFIDYVARQDFAGAAEITVAGDTEPEDADQANRQPGWSIKGYGVGAYLAGNEPRTSLPFNVFICEDNRLWVWMSGKNGDAFATAVPSDSFRAVKERETLEPDSVVPVPKGDRYGNLLPPAIGHFVLGYQPPEYKTVPGAWVDTDMGGYNEPDIKQVVSPGVDLIRFEALELERVLTIHALHAYEAAHGLLDPDGSETAAFDRQRFDPLPLGHDFLWSGY